MDTGLEYRTLQRSRFRSIAKAARQRLFYGRQEHVIVLNAENRSLVIGQSMAIAGL